MPTGIVILISIAISLAIVFFIVFCAMGCLFFKRKRDAKVNPESNPSAYYGKPPRDPQELLMTLQKADSGLNDDKNNDGYNNFEEKRRNTLEPSDQLYNMSKSISTDHLHDPHASQSSFNMGLGTAGIGAGVAATALGVGASKSHEVTTPSTMQDYITLPDGTKSYTPINDYYTSSPVMTYHNNAPMSNHSNIAPVNNYGNNVPTHVSTAGMGAAASLGASAFGMARPESFTRPVSEINRDSITSSPIKTREMTELYNNENRNSYNPFRSSSGIGMAIGTGVGAVTAATAIHENNSNKDEYSFLSTPPTAQQVSYGNISPSQATSATHNNPDTVRWTQAPPEVTSVAVVQPVSMLNVDNNNTPENVRWTTANSDDAKAQAIIAPVISLDQQYQDNHQQENGTLRNMSTNNNNASALSVAQPENVRWTNFSTSNAMGTLTVDPGRESTYSDFYSSPDANYNNLSIPPQPQPSQSSSSLAADPETVRWTTNSPSNNLAVAQIENLDRDSYQPSLASKLYDESETSVNAKVIHPNAFRLSDVGSLAQNPNFKSDNRVSRYDIGSASEDDEENEAEKEVRWKVANVASPIETGEPPKLIEPASVAITSRNQTPDEVSSPFESYFDNIMFVNKEEGAQKSSRDIHEVDDSNNDNPFLSDNYSEKAKSIDDLIATRDLAGLSFILNEADQHPQPQQPQMPEQPEPSKPSELIVPQPSTSTPVDGRAASKRMVQEYLNNKKSDQRDKKDKYQSNFKQLMATAIENNTKSQYATEDQPHLYYAKFDFSQSEEDELGFGKGDAIIVIDSSDDIWWTGFKANGKLKKKIVFYMIR